MVLIHIQSWLCYLQMSYSRGVARMIEAEGTRYKWLLYHFNQLFVPCDLWLPLWASLQPPSGGVTRPKFSSELPFWDRIWLQKAWKYCVTGFTKRCDPWQTDQLFTSKGLVTCDWRVGRNGTVMPKEEGAEAIMRSMWCKSDWDTCVSLSRWHWPCL